MLAVIVGQIICFADSVLFMKYLFSETCFSRYLFSDFLGHLCQILWTLDFHPIYLAASSIYIFAAGIKTSTKSFSPTIMLPTPLTFHLFWFVVLFVLFVLFKYLGAQLFTSGLSSIWHALFFINIMQIWLHKLAVK